MFQLARAITRINRWIGRWMSIAILILFAFLLADVVMRYVAGAPALWTAELAVLIFGVYAVLGGGYLLAERGHVNVDIFYGALSQKRKALIDLLTWPLFVFFVGILFWEGFKLALESIQDMERSNSLWKPYFWPTKSFIPVAAALLLAQGLVRLWADVRILMGLPVPEDIFGIQAPDEDQQGKEAGA